MKIDLRRRWKGKYLATDGKLVLWLHVAKEDGYVVTAPFDHRVITQAETIEEAFEMANDVIRTYEQIAREERRSKRRRTKRHLA